MSAILKCEEIFCEPFSKNGGDGSSGYNLFSIPASFSHRVIKHGKVQAGEEVMLEVINSQQLNTFRELCSLEEQQG